MSFRFSSQVLSFCTWHLRMSYYMTMFLRKKWIKQWVLMTLFCTFYQMLFCKTDKYQILICVVFLALLLNLSSLMDFPYDALFIMESIVIFKWNDSSYDWMGTSALVWMKFACYWLKSGVSIIMEVIYHPFFKKNNLSIVISQNSLFILYIRKVL